MTQEELFKILVAHCKEYGFIFPSSEIYDGLVKACGLSTSSDSSGSTSGS